MLKPHYFNDEQADPNDMPLGMAKMQGYVPDGCLLGGSVVMGLVGEGKSPCAGCEGPRARCGGYTGHVYKVSRTDPLAQRCVNCGSPDPDKSCTQGRKDKP